LRPKAMGKGDRGGKAAEGKGEVKRGSLKTVG